MSNMKLLYVGDKVIGNPTNGGDVGRLRMRAMLQDIYPNVEIVEMPKISLFQHFINVLFKRNYGHCSYIWNVIKICDNSNCDYVFFDGSSNGKYIQYLNKRNVKTIVYCQNVESKYYEARYESNKSIINWVLKKYIYYNENLAIKFSTKLIAITERDSDVFFFRYGKKADYILPTSFPSIESKINKNTRVDDSYLLFVGSDFFPNNEGIVWFIKEVSARVDIKVFVVGSCCRAVEKMIDISNYPNVYLKGFVDDIDLAYRNAIAVICPIFSGSGIKTKTIEALQYGKSVLGTTEAFVGIDADFSKIGGLCNTSDEFVKAVNGLSDSTFNKYALELFNSCFLYETVRDKFKAYLESI